MPFKPAFFKMPGFFSAVLFQWQLLLAQLFLNPSLSPPVQARGKLFTKGRHLISPFFKGGVRGIL